jgi:hypothetical protein
VLERRVIFEPAGDLAGAAGAFGHNFLSLDADGPVRHVVRLSGPATARCHRSGSRRPLRTARIDPASVRVDGTLLRMGDRVMPLERRELNTSEGRTPLSVEFDQLPRPVVFCPT